MKNKIFYTSENYTSHPNILNPKNKFSKKYDSDTKIENIPIILENLYKNSISRLPRGKAFQIFQQIAISNKVNIKKYLVAVEFKKCNRSDKKIIMPMIDYLKNKYPSIKIKNNNI